jgi:2-keto-3-deoxy-L-rhamnonate aldolase RhmA
MNAIELKNALRSGKRVYGTLTVAPSPLWVAQIKKLALDFVFIDTEHLPLDRQQISWMCQAYRAMNVAPLVRVTSPDHFQATNLLDGGACGIVVPYVETAEQAKTMRGAVKMRPLRGQLLQNILDGTQGFPGELKSYVEAHNRENLLIINIESKPALDALDEILEIPDIDAILVGPHDLSCSLGIPEQYHHPEFERAVREIFRKARAKNIGAGMHFWAGLDQQIVWAQEAGMNLIIHRADILNFVESMSAELREIRAALGDTADAAIGGLNI